jgi:organic radical activating enzyme
VSARRYSIASVFATYQGEGIHSGRRAVFVRFAGCNAWSGHEAGRGKGAGACAQWCDTNFLPTESLTAVEIVTRMETLYPDDGHGRRLCVITGGEPTLQLTVDLIEVMHAAQWEIAVETNASVPDAPVHLVDLLTVSPKRGLTVNTPLIRSAALAELKVVVPGVAVDALGRFTPWSADDLRMLGGMRRWAACWLHPQDVPHTEPTFDVHVTHLQRASAGGVQSPERVQRAFDANVRRCIELAEELGGRWRLGVQMHKVLGLA